MSVRNEEYYLPSCIEHLIPYVDKFIIYNDRSSDSTSDIIDGYKDKIIHLKSSHFLKSYLYNYLNRKKYYNERAVRKLLINTAKNNQFDMVLCIDADERLEQNFLENIRTIAKDCYTNDICLGFKFRELYNDIHHFRCDGIWNEKRKYVFFPLAESMTFRITMPHYIHTAWHYDQIGDRLQLSEYNLYHLKMINEKERIKRAQTYESLDPLHKIQPFGYMYLINEDVMELRRVDKKRAFDDSFLPEDLKP